MPNEEQYRWSHEEEVRSFQHGASEALAWLDDCLASLGIMREHGYEVKAAALAIHTAKVAAAQARNLILAPVLALAGD